MERFAYFNWCWQCYVCCNTNRYLTELLAERNKLGPFMAVLPNSYRLLNQGEFTVQHVLSLLYSDEVPLCDETSIFYFPITLRIIPL